MYHPLTEFEINLFQQGRYFKAYEKLGAHPREMAGQWGTHFAVWAPNAGKVSVIGDFNGWDRTATPLYPRWDDSGIWEGFVAEARHGMRYKFAVWGIANQRWFEKGDPYALFWEESPRTASIIWDLDYEWNDNQWMMSRHGRNAPDAPMSIYEIHLGSWRRDPADPDRFLSYREIARDLVEHVKHCGYTHVELLPVMEHPFYGSWGYQITGYFAPTSRYGCPQDFMYLIDHLHQNGIGVILDWVPSHFPTDEKGLAYFDGTHLFEHADPRQGFHPDWDSAIYNYGRDEVRGFLISNALFWIEQYHADGLRVDAVASMLYLDYSRKPGEWIPNKNGGRENEEAIAFLQELNTEVYRYFPDVQMIAEESTSWPSVSRPVHYGGLGFGYKWNMGWMHDTLHYVSQDPINRKHHHDEITFGIWYFLSENFILSLSHDEVVHLKGSLLRKMPGDDWQKFAGLRLLLGYQATHPGKQMVFMGAEFAQRGEWHHDQSLDWHLLEHAPHWGVLQWVSDLNRVYRSLPALFQKDYASDGFEWVEVHDRDYSVLAFLRRGYDGVEPALVICNFTPVPHHHRRFGVPDPGPYHELLNSDNLLYGGSGVINSAAVEAEEISSHGRPYSVSIAVPPLAVLILSRKSL